MKIKFKILIIVSLILLGQVGIANAGFGISPPTLSNKNLVPGSFYQQDVYLVQSEPDQTLNVAVKIDAGQINSWIKIENGNNFQIPKGTQQFPMKISVNIPSNAELKKYTGRITLSTSPAGEQKSGVSVVLGAEIKIDLDVGSIQVSDFSIQNFQIPDVLKGKPIKFVIKVKNDGNIDNGPTKVALAFYDQYHDKNYSKLEKDITQKVKSFQTEDISVEFTNDLEVGSYWADVKIYNGSGVVVDSKLVFNIVASNQTNKETGSKFVMPDFSKIPPWVYILVLSVIIITILIIVIIVLLKKKRIPNNQEKNSETKKIKIHK